MHGELEAPEDALVRGAARVLVPRQEVADAFVQAGMAESAVLVTGICVEHELADAAAACLLAREARLSTPDATLTVALFSSGAEPTRHVETLAAAALALAGTRHRAMVFASCGGRLEAALLRGSALQGGVEIVRFDSRAAVDRVTAARFPEIDLVVSPPHERSNWAYALGVPFLLVGPDVGPFAPRNRALLLAAGVAAEIDSPSAARCLPRTLDGLLAGGALARMCLSGGGRPFRGFEAAARHLQDEALRRIRTQVA